MNVLRLSAIVFVFLVASAVNVYAVEWRGIVPMRSIREDVERLLGAPQMSSPNAYYYDFREEIAVVHFQSVSCAEPCSPEWDVAPGTVLSVAVIPKRRYQREKALEKDLKVENTGSGFRYLTNEEKGLTLEEYKSAVTLISYSHALKDTPSLCPRARECIADLLVLFDEYRRLTFADEKARLDNFGLIMKESFARGAIVVYGRNHKERIGLLMRAERGKKYLMKVLGFPALRVLVVDGGYRDKSATQLHLYPIGGSSSRIYLFPETDPSVAAPNKRPQRTRR